MTLPDVRRLLQVVFAPEPPENPFQCVIDISEWRQTRNQIAAKCHAKARRKRLRSTG